MFSEKYLEILSSDFLLTKIPVALKLTQFTYSIDNLNFFHWYN